MKIGFYTQWNKNSLDDSNKGNVLGDELLALSLCKALLKDPRVKSAELYAPNFLPTQPLDYMIYLNDTEPREKWALCHVSYLQNGYGESAESLLKRFHSYQMDGYIFFSKKLEEIHNRLSSSKSAFIPFGVDTEFFYPRKKKKEFSFDVSYVGNDIKGKERSNLYLYPATHFNFGLYGNWSIPKARFKRWKNWFRKLEPYQKEFEKISRGRIAQEDVPVLYSSSSVNLNCTLQDCVDWDVITLRTFEVLASKGFLISDIVPEAKEKLKDMVVFTSGGDDLRAKIEYYLSHPKEREEISENGYLYVQKNASILSRAVEITNFLESLKI